MSKEFTALLKDERSGGEVAPPGLSLGKILSEVGAELKHQAEFGAHEIASVLFRNEGFVMYPHAGKEAEVHGLPEMQQEQERGGKEM